MKVRKQNYLGSSTIAMYINDSSEWVKRKIQEKEAQEAAKAKQQQENFTSTVSHEMRTPLATTIFFLTQVIQLLHAPTPEV